MSVIKPGFRHDSEFKPNWIAEKIDEDGINYLENLGFYLTDKRTETDKSPGDNAMTATQVRNIYGEIKRIQAQGDTDSWQTEFLMLRPKVAYNTARVQSKQKFDRRENRIPENRIVVFREVFEKAHGHVGNDFERFKRFCQFVEAIIAYHKVYGGKD